MTRHTRRLLVRGALSGEQDTNAPLANQDESDPGEEPQALTTPEFSLGHGHRGFASDRGAAAVGGPNGRKTTMHDRFNTRRELEADSQSYTRTYAAYVRDFPNVRCKTTGRRRASYASYASYAVCVGGVCVCARPPAPARARYALWGVRNPVRCVRCVTVPSPSANYSLTTKRKMALDGGEPTVRWGGAA